VKQIIGAYRHYDIEYILLVVDQFIRVSLATGAMIDTLLRRQGSSLLTVDNPTFPVSL
jgi:hypothetical protein